ncbi:hypothetical protein [Nocardia concava]|uniref:hypothetical protein n=1 Tax=Nocardia concava TaxID=257281 RepID=UPI0002D4E887|nr:hypothetical protein [Nocardia concava]
MSDADSWDLDAPEPTYEVQADGRVALHVLGALGDDAFAATPWHTSTKPMRLSVSEIARDCDLPAAEVVGRDYTAAGDANSLHDFQLVNDPRV